MCATVSSRDLASVPKGPWPRVSCRRGVGVGAPEHCRHSFGIRPSRLRCWLPVEQSTELEPQGAGES